MGKSKSLFQQKIGYEMFFVFFLLFNTDILVVGQNTDQTVSPETDTESSLHISPSSIALLNSHSFSNVPIASDRSPPDAITSSAPSRSMRPTVHQAESLKTAPLVSAQEIIHSPTAMSSATPGDTSTQSQDSTPILDNVTFSTKEKSHHIEAAVVQVISTTLGQKTVSTEMTVAPDFDTTVGKKGSPPIKDFDKSSEGSFFEPTPSKSTGPRQDERETTELSLDISALAQTQEPGHHYKFHFTTPSTTPVSKAPESGSPATSTSKKYTVIILAVVFSILLLVGLLVFLYCRHRHHSGSTSFNAPAWAGQAALPDDSGLEKDVEQEAGAVGEGETRRGTLVTFFGKRPSRVPSIAMEDVNGKGGKGETEQLLRGEGSEDANGKVPEPLAASSQESPAPIS